MYFSLFKRNQTEKIPLLETGQTGLVDTPAVPAHSHQQGRRATHSLAGGEPSAQDPGSVHAVQVLTLSSLQLEDLEERMQRHHEDLNGWAVTMHRFTRKRVAVTGLKKQVLRQHLQ